MSSNDVFVLAAVASGLVVAAFITQRGPLPAGATISPPDWVSRPARRAQGPSRADAAGRRSGDLAHDGRHPRARDSFDARLGTAEFPEALARHASGVMLRRARSG